MKKFDPMEITLDKVEKDAKTIVKESHCAAFIATRWLRSLERCDRDKTLKWFGIGKVWYETYVYALTKEINRLQPTRRLKTTDFPVWGSVEPYPTL